MTTSTTGARGDGDRRSVDAYLDRATDAYRAALAEALGDVVPEAEPELLGRRAAAGALAGVRWTDAVGPFHDTHGAAVALGGVSKQAVSQRVTAGRLLALRLAPDGSGLDRLVYPVWQFHPTVLAQLPDVLAAAGLDPDRPTTGWTIAAWLTTDDPELDGRSPLDLLRAGLGDEVRPLAFDVAESLGAAERRSRTPHRRAG